MSEILKEITVWKSGTKPPNHTYLLSDSGKLIAYAPWHGDDIFLIKSGMKIDKRYRKFIKSNHTALSKLLTKEKIEPGVRKFKVKSKEKEYTVSVKNDRYSCTCTGFTFRSKCKHITAVAEKLQTA